MTTRSRKRKADEAVEEEAGTTIESAWDSLKASSLTLYKSLALFMEDGAEMEEESDQRRHYTKLMAATYYKRADMENQFVVPLEFRDFKICRDKKGAVVRITDSKEHSISGKFLKIVMVYSAMKSRGHDTVILGKADDEGVEAMVIADGIQVDDTDTLRGLKDFHNEGRMLYTHKAGTAVYVPTKVLVDVLTLEYVTIADVSNLVKALNSLAAKEDLTDFDAKALVDVKTINTALLDQDLKKSRKHLFTTLLAAKISKMSIDERVRLFSENPSYTLANNLELRLPHSGPCFAKLNNKRAPTVMLSTLGPDDDVLLSTNVMSLKDYSDIGGDVAKYCVYKDTEELGARRGNKFVDMPVKFKEKASLVTKYLNAISSANGKEGNAGAIEGTDTEVVEGGLSIELDY